MNCTTCGEPLAPGTLFCPNCGTRVSAETSAAPTIALPEARPPDRPVNLTKPYAERPATPVPALPLPPAAPQWAGQGAPIGTPAALPNSTAALVSLVFGILGWVMLPVIGPIVAVVAGHMARNEIRGSNGQLGGDSLATAGLILGYIQLALIGLAICAIIGIGVLTLLGSRA